MDQYKTPTETIELPSKGLVYPEGNPLSVGTVELQYMTAYHEDILTNQNYIQQGIVLDKLLQDLIVTKINYDDLLLKDKDALLISSRILGYGKDYSFKLPKTGEIITIDMSKLENKPLDERVYVKGKNEFKFVLPNTETEISFKLLTVGDDKKIKQELEGYKKIKQNPELLVRLKHMILSVGGSYDRKIINEFVDKRLLAKDSKAFRDYLKKIQPGLDLTYIHEIDGLEEKLEIPIGVDFFWPELDV